MLIATLVLECYPVSFLTECRRKGLPYWEKPFVFSHQEMTWPEIRRLNQVAGGGWPFKVRECPAASFPLPRLIDGSVLPGCTVRLSLGPWALSPPAAGSAQVAFLPQVVDLDRPWTWRRKLGGFGSRQPEECPHTALVHKAGQGFKGSRVWRRPAGTCETGRRSSFLGHPRDPTHGFTGSL